MLKNFVDRTLHVEALLRDVIILTINNAFEALDGVFEFDGKGGELFVADYSGKLLQRHVITDQTRLELYIGDFASGTLLRFDEHKTENIVRTLLSQSGQDGKLRRQEYGVEVAYSDQESWLKLWSADADGAAQLYGALELPTAVG